jgi:type IV secretory pathway VirB2 component (pilin)
MIGTENNQHTFAAMLAVLFVAAMGVLLIELSYNNYFRLLRRVGWIALFSGTSIFFLVIILDFLGIIQ